MEDGGEKRGSRMEDGKLKTETSVFAWFAVKNPSVPLLSLLRPFAVNPPPQFLNRQTAFGGSAFLRKGLSGNRLTAGFSG